MSISKSPGANTRQEALQGKDDARRDTYPPYDVETYGRMKWQLEKRRGGIGLKIQARARHNRTQSPPAIILDRSPGRYPGSQDLPHRLPGLSTSGMDDATTLAYRCGGSSGIASEFH